MKQFNLKSILVATLLLVASFGSFAQDRSVLTNTIKQHQNCRLVAMTEGAGQAAIIYDSGYATVGIPQQMTDMLLSIKNQGLKVDDVHINENNAWIILYGSNGYSSANAPQALLNELQNLKNAGHIFRSVTFNTTGDWTIVTNNSIVSSSEELNNWVSSEMSELGGVTSCFFTDYGKVVVHEMGYKTEGEVPDGLTQGLNNASIDYTHVSFTRQHWFYADAQGNYSFVM